MENDEEKKTQKTRLLIRRPEQDLQLRDFCLAQPNEQRLNERKKKKSIRETSTKTRSSSRYAEFVPNNKGARIHTVQIV